MFRYAAITQKGTEKGKNEDRIMVAGNFLSGGELQGETEGPLLIILCDGIGGEAFGDEAAEIVCLNFLPLCRKPLSIFDISSSVIDSNNAVLMMQKNDQLRKHMATTLAGVHISRDKYIAFNAGDSRVYSYRDSYMTQLSHDHTEAQYLIDVGKICRIEDTPKSSRNTVTRYIGTSEKRSAAKINRGPLDSKSFLLCSDGIYKKVPMDIIERVLSREIPVMDKCRVLINEAIEKGSTDDLSVAVVEQRSPGIPLTQDLQ